MDIYKKRSLASTIDDSLIMIPCAFIVVYIKMEAPEFLNPPYNFIFMALIFICLMTYLAFGQFIFKNASIGMKIMKISKYNKDWEYQTLRHHLKNFRVGGGNLQKHHRIYSFRLWPHKEHIMELIYYEKDKLGYFYIENAVYDKLSAEARAMDGDFVRNMTDLYIAYLEKIYLDC